MSQVLLHPICCALLLSTEAEEEDQEDSGVMSVGSSEGNDDTGELSEDLDDFLQPGMSELHAAAGESTAQVKPQCIDLDDSLHHSISCSIA